MSDKDASAGGGGDTSPPSVDMGAGSRAQTYRGQFKPKLRLVSSNPAPDTARHK
jgi:hypothetical protein